MLGSGSSWLLQRCHIYQLSAKSSLGLRRTSQKNIMTYKPSDIQHEHQAVDKIKAAVLSHAIEGNQLYSFITNAYVQEEHVAQILNADEIGHKLYTEYIPECINGDASLWAHVKK